MAYIGDNPKHKSTKYTPQSADPSNPVEGQVQYADGTVRVQGLWQYNGTVWEQVGNQGGSLDLILVENFDGGTNAAAFTQGQSAVFGASGTVGGTLADVESGQIQGRRSMKFTTSTTADDWFHVDAVTMGEKQHTKFVSCSIYAKWNGTLDEMKFKVLDVDNTTELDSVSIDTSNVLKRYTLSFWVPSDCDSIKVGFQHLGTTGSEVLEFDDLMVTQNPLDVFQIPNIEDWTDFTPTASAGFGTISNASGKWRRVGDSMEVRGFFTAGTAAASIAEINIPAGHTIDAAKLNATTSREFIGMFHRVDSGQSYYTGTIGAVIHPDISNLDRILIGGDSSSNTAIRSDNGNSIISTGESAIFRFTVPILGWTSVSEGQVVSNASAANSMVRLNGSNGYGSTSTYIRRWDTVETNTGSAITYADDSTNGSQFTVNEDGMYNISFTYINSAGGEFGLSLNAAGSTDPNGTGSDNRTTSILTLTRAQGLLEINSVAAVNVPENVSVQIQLNKNDVIRAHTRALADSSSDHMETFTISKIGTTQVTGVPFPITAYVKDEKASTTHGGTFTSGAYRTRDLNVLSGDTTFVSLSANQFTLGSGTYDIVIHPPAVNVNLNKAKLRNITDSTDDLIGTAAQSQTSNSTDYSLIQGRLVLTSSKTFEVQHRCSTTVASTGFGTASSFGEVEVYTQVKITKIK